MSIGSYSWTDRRKGTRGVCSIAFWTGRIDNRADLLWRIDPDTDGAIDDSSIVLCLYERAGVRGLSEIIGDWSVVIIDECQDVVVLASDYAGARPLYYYRKQDQIVWGLELGAVAAAAGSAVDEEYLAAFLVLGGVSNRTPYTGVLVVPAGYAMCASIHGISVEVLWRPPIHDRVHYDQHCYDEVFRSLFRAAVAVRLRDREPVCAELSGGLDSSAIVCMAARLIQAGLVPATELYTVSYLQQDSADAQFIRAVRAWCKVQGSDIAISARSLVEWGEPGAAIEEWSPLYRVVAKTMRSIGAVTLLTGQGGDLVTGNCLDDSQQIVAHIRVGRLRRAWREAREWSMASGTSIFGILARTAYATVPGVHDDIVHGCWTSSRAPEHGILSKVLVGRVKESFPHGCLSRDWLQAPIERRRRLFGLTMMRELRPMRALDPSGIVSCTHPFTHRPLVEFLMSIPADVLCGPGEPRRLMRRALAELWPPEVRRRRSKALFGAAWLQALKAIARGLSTPAEWHVVRRAWIDQAGLSLALRRLSHGLECGPDLRRVILLEHWLRCRSLSGGSASETSLLRVSGEERDEESHVA